jgi:thiol-disulfide isomerase/thioredoxin
MSSRVAGRFAAPLVAVVWLAGCNDSPAPSAEGTQAEQAAAAVSLRVADADEYQRQLDTHRGQVVLVDFWATWCMPCVQQFPHTVELAHEYQPRGLAVMTVSMNEPEEEPDVLEFLKRHDADVDNLLSKYGGGSEAIEAFGLPGSVPCYRVYDRHGALRHEFSVDPLAEEQFTPDDIARAIEELL